MTPSTGLRLCLGLLLAAPFCVEMNSQAVPPAQQGSKLDAAAAASLPVPAAPLPDLKSLLDRAKANSDKWDELRKNYMCKEAVTADELDSHGNKKGQHTDEYRVFFVNKSEVQQHIAHDGKPLSADQEKKEQERVDKQIAESKLATDNNKQRGHITLHASSLLRMTTVSSPRREMIEGRPTILFDYQGDLKAKANDLAEEVMKKLSGHVWVDEEDAAITHLDGELSENFHVAGGLLVNVKKGSHFTIDATRVNGEIWFNHKLEIHVDGRIVLFKGFDSAADIVFSDYRKMKSSITIQPGFHVLDADGNPVPDAVEPAITAPRPQ